MIPGGYRTSAMAPAHHCKSWTLFGVIITEIQLDVKAVAGHISGAFGAVGHGQVNFNLAWILQAGSRNVMVFLDRYA